ncbi:MAG: hypothetical protein H0U18_08190, partial [Pyrinomonadaceae bacterium]|nr:hypothetical protein [Pyrinomonadaceae bacterium]
SRTFGFTASGECGSTITLTFQLSDGTNNQGTVSFTFTLGAIVNIAPAYTENFDDETPPALPVGWTTLFIAPGGKPWTTTSAFSDTAPNSAATVADVQGDLNTCSGGQGGADLTSEPIAIPNPPAEGINRSVQLSFRNFYNLEPSFDGGALEISINGGAFQDIVAAGGSFVSGGYNGTVGVDPGNPLSGRPAWTGNSAGFITTLVNLPNSANGQTVRFRWRTGYDGCFTPENGGMRVDTISIFGSSRICNNCPTPQDCTPTTTVTEGDLFPGGIVSFGVSSGPNSVTVDHVNAGTGLQSFTVVGVATNAVVTIPPFTPGTFNPVTATFTVINPSLPVDFTLRAASTFHSIFIRVRCAEQQAGNTFSGRLPSMRPLRE